MADFGTDGADPRAVDETTGVTVVPVLVGKLSLSQRKCAELVIQVLGILEKGGGREGEERGKEWIWLKV